VRKGSGAKLESGGAVEGRALDRVGEKSDQTRCSSIFDDDFGKPSVNAGSSHPQSFNSGIVGGRGEIRNGNIFDDLLPAVRERGVVDGARGHRTVRYYHCRLCKQVSSPTDYRLYNQYTSACTMLRYISISLLRFISSIHFVYCNHLLACSFFYWFVLTYSAACVSFFVILFSSIIIFLWWSTSYTMNF